MASAQFDGLGRHVNSVRISEPPGKQWTTLETTAALSEWEASQA
jgi:hypothetical protein